MSDGVIQIGGWRMSDGVMRVALVEFERRDGVVYYELCSDLWVVKSGREVLPDEIRVFDGTGKACRYRIAESDEG